MPRKADYFSFCLHGIGKSFLFRVSKSHNYISPIMFVWTMIHSLMVLEDPQIHSEFFTFSVSLSQLPCVFASKGLHWDPRLLKLACMQHREPEVTGVTCRWWSCVRVWKTSSLAHSSTLAWKIPWTEEHGRLQSMGLQRVRHDWVTLLTYLLELNLYARALQDQGGAICCETLPEITTFLDFCPFSSLFLLRTSGFS